MLVTVSDALVLEENFQMLFHAADCMTRCPMLLGGSNNLFKMPWRMPSRHDFICCCQRQRKLNSTDQSSHITLQLRKGCRAKAKTDQTLRAFIHVLSFCYEIQQQKSQQRKGLAKRNVSTKFWDTTASCSSVETMKGRNSTPFLQVEDILLSRA